MRSLGAFNPFERLDDSADIGERSRRNLRAALALAAIGAALAGSGEFLSHEVKAELGKSPTSGQIVNSPSGPSMLRQIYEEGYLPGN